MTGRDQLQLLLGTLRRQHRQRVLIEGAAIVLVSIGASLLLGALATRTLGLTSAGVLAVRLLGYGVILGAAARWLVWPITRRRDDAAFAHYVESRAPELKQALLTAVETSDAAGETPSSPSLGARVVDGAVRALSPIAAGGTIERAQSVRAQRLAAATALLVLLVVALGPRSLRDAAKVLFAPWSIAIAATPPAPVVAVEPGDVTVARGGTLDIKATIEHLTADGAELVFRGDSAADWVRLPMGRDAEAFAVRLFDITSPTEYYVEAAGVRSRSHRIRVTDLPAVQRLAVELRFPAYTGRAAERDEDGGDVAALVGTTVIIEPTLTRAARFGALVFDDGTSVPLAGDSTGQLRASFRVRTSGFYRVDLTADDGRSVSGGVQYAVEALADRAPTVRIETPGRDTKSTALDEVTVDVKAEDDYGVRSLELRYRVNGGAEQRVVLRAPVATARGDAQGAHTLMLEDLGLKPGDLIAYNAAATDARDQEALSDVYFLEIRPWSRDYRQSESNAAGQQAGQPGESAGEFVKRQREIVAGTYNWVRDSATRAVRERAEDVTTLAIAQGQLREEVATLVARLRERGVVAQDSTMAAIHSVLDSAATEMKRAEERLGRRDGRGALPSEERALALVQRADAAYREVQLQQNAQQNAQPGGGGAGGEQSDPEDLADLFELETDRMRNQYEAVQQQSSAAPQREVDETLERLRQLASRQQQENERLQRQSQAMRERMGREASGGGGGSQRELARQAEEEARRLERLARERESEDLAEAARQMQRAADAMRQAATGSEAQGASALEQLGRATRALEDARTRGLAEGVRELADRAREMEQEQREIAAGVAGLPTASLAERAQRLRALGERKDSLSAAVEALEVDADALARESRREQPGASGRMREASDAIRDQRVRDKVQFSKRVMQSGSPEYANAFEEQIGENIAEAAESLREAVNALSGEGAARQQERAIDAARELVRGVESLRERTTGEGGQGQQRPEGEQGQQGRTGEAGGPGERGGREPAQGGAPRSADGAPGGRLTPGEARQFAREFGLRRENAEQLRELARAQGADVTELDRAIRDLRQLESGRALGDLHASAALQAALLERLRGFEFALHRQLSQESGRRGALGARSPVPSEYRADVEEYYRSLARPRP